MKAYTLSLIDNDATVKAATGLDFKDDQSNKFESFIHQVQEELSIGQVASIEINDGAHEPVRFYISQYEYEDQ